MSWENVGAGEIEAGQMICFARNFGYHEARQIRVSLNKLPVMMMVLGKVIKVGDAPTHPSARWHVEMEIHQESFMNEDGMLENYDFSENASDDIPKCTFRFTSDQSITVILSD